MNKSLVFIFFTSLLASCATFAPQLVTVKADVSVTASAAGLGKVVALRVIDARLDKVLGYRTTRTDKDSAILTNQDVASVVQQSIYSALKKNGFDVIAQSDGPRSLKVEIRKLEYYVPTGSWIDGIQVRTTLGAVVKNGDMTYENIYEITNKDRMIIAPDQEKNEALINKALSDILQRLLQDQQLIALLAR
jgi:uncharacterized lipoprotein YajG